MTNTFYRPDERAAGVNDLFTLIAPRYDLMNDLQSFGLHRRWKHRLVALAKARAGDRALDVCCGTGDIAFGLANCGCHTIGLDFNEPMLLAARHRCGHKSADANPSTRNDPMFVRGDAQQLPFAPASFDIATVGYGLRNLSNWENGLREMHRVLRPGGRLLVLEFGKPNNALWRALYFAYLRVLVPVLGRLFGGSAAAYAYIMESLSHYPSAVGVAEKLRELGFNNVQIVHLIGGVMSIHSCEKTGK
jgi:demethylmenaquinone methyltransferase/2-methoxy-6-polyprenyl-1,4-benzoquinol methylase